MAIVEKFAIEGGTCELHKYGTLVLRAWPHPDGLPGDIRLSRADLAELFRLACGDNATMFAALARVFEHGHRFDDYIEEEFPYNPNNDFEYREEPF
jgi:hypothetical protein